MISDHVFVIACTIILAKYATILLAEKNHPVVYVFDPARLLGIHYIIWLCQTRKLTVQHSIRFDIQWELQLVIIKKWLADIHYAELTLFCFKSSCNWTNSVCMDFYCRTYLLDPTLAMCTYVMSPKINLYELKNPI